MKAEITITGDFPPEFLDRIERDPQGAYSFAEGTVTVLRQAACRLALTLLEGHEICPQCGQPAGDHREWQREKNR